MSSTAHKTPSTFGIVVGYILSYAVLASVVPFALKKGMTKALTEDEKVNAINDELDRRITLLTAVIPLETIYIDHQ